MDLKSVHSEKISHKFMKVKIVVRILTAVLNCNKSEQPVSLFASEIAVTFLSA